MTRTLSLAVIALLGLSTVAHGQVGSSSSGCGPETWSTDSMAYVGVPCGDAPTRAPQQAAAPLTDAQYCGVLVTRYDTFLNKDGRHGGMLSTDVAANVAAAKCRAGDGSGIADLERALKDAKVDLPPRS
jgi:hypothetical protein